MPRLDKQRQNEKEPKRMSYTKAQIQKQGYPVTEVSTCELQFKFKGEVIKFFPYSGWHSGKTIKDGRGLKNLIKQIKTK